MRIEKMGHPIIGHVKLGQERMFFQLPAPPPPPECMESEEEWVKKQRITVPETNAGDRERERAAERERAVQKGQEWDRERERIQAEERARAESIWKQRGQTPTGVKVWGGKELDAGTSEMSVDDAFATYRYYYIYGTTPFERGGATPVEKLNVERWAAIAKKRFNELTLAGVKLSTLWAAVKGAATSLWNNPLVVYNPMLMPFTSGVRFWIGVPQTLEDMQTRAEQRTKLLIEGGYDPHAAGLLAFIMSIGDLLPSNKFVESISGTSLDTGRHLTPWERTKAGTAAIIETILLALGGTPKRIPKPIFIVGETAEGSLVVSPVAKPIWPVGGPGGSSGEAGIFRPIGWEVPLGPMRPPTPFTRPPPLPNRPVFTTPVSPSSDPALILRLPFKPRGTGPGAPFVEFPLQQPFRPALHPGDLISPYQLEEAHAWIRANPSWRLRWIPSIRMYEITEAGAPLIEIPWWE